MSGTEPREKDIEKTASIGEQCPIGGCSKTVGDGHWVVDTPGFHTYHTDKEGIARTWEHRDGLLSTPATKPYTNSRYVNNGPDRRKAGGNA